MRSMWAIARKELQLYFYSPVVYTAFAFYFLIASWLFTSNFLWDFTIDVRPITSSISFVFLLIAPLLTMRLVSDELRHGTDELLLTSPASITQIVTGKYIAAVVVQFILVLGSLIYPLILSFYGDLDQASLWLSYLSLFLIGSTMMAVGLFASSLTAHQMVAGITAFGILLVLWTIEWMGDTVGGKVKDYLGTFSITNRVLDMQKGILDISDILFYVTLSAVFIVLSIQVLERKRWK